jgi:hypothetical protein
MQIFGEALAPGDGCSTSLHRAVVAFIDREK